MREQRWLADFDHAEVEGDTLTVRGAVPPGTAVCLAPRRYKSQPEWAGVEVMAVEVGGSDVDDPRFELSCSIAGLWGRDGVEVLGETLTERFPRR